MSDPSRHGTSSTLSIAGTYQTPFLNIERYENINIIVNTDESGTLFVEYSIDGVNIDYTNSVEISGNRLNGSFNSYKVISRFARIRYLNGATEQSTFRLQITLKELGSGESFSDSSISSSNLEGGVDELNSTIDLLGISETFTGTFVDNSIYSSVTIVANVDVIGTLKFQFSADGITVDRTKTVQVIPARGSKHTLAVISKFFRVEYVNGTTAQSSMIIQTILHKFKSKNLTATTSESIGPGNDVELVRIANNLEVDIALGRVGDQSANFIFGTNRNISTTEEDIWEEGGIYNWLSSATTLEIVSIDVADDIAGLGAQAVVILGLDANFDEIQEVVLMNGAGTSGATTNLFLRVNRVAVVQAGTLRGSNFDDLTIQASGGGVVLSNITGTGSTGNSDYGYGISQMGLYTIPAKKDFLVEDLTINVSGGKTVTINAYGLTNPTTLGSAKLLIFTLDEFSGLFRVGKNTFDRIAPKTDIWFSGFTGTGSSALDIRLYFKLIDVPP